MPKLGKSQLSAQTEIFQRLVRDLMRPPPVCVAPGTSVGEVVNRMTETASSSAVVVDAGSRPRGIVTEQDVVRRIAWRVEPDQAVEAVMTTPVVVVGADDYLFEAVALMRRRKFRHVPVVDGAGAVIGMLGLEGALGFLSSENLALIDQLTHEESIEGLKRVKLAQVELVSALLQKNVPVPEVQALLTEINNDIHRRALRQLEAAMREDGWGEFPSRFAVIIMGSGGRGENFLAPDQDNGFVIADDEDGGQGRRKDAYFSELAERMTRVLDAVGLRRCIGNVMATNPLWRKTLSEWRRQIDTWIVRGEPEMLMNCGIFFDFRHGFGDPELSRQLRAHITDVVPKFPQFLHRVFAAESEQRTVALGWLGRLRIESYGDERKGVVNLKLRGTLPLVQGTRLLALRAGIPVTSTLARLAALKEQGALNAADHDDLADAFKNITHLLLRQQLEDFRAGRDISNYVPDERLSRREKKHLLASFRAIEDLRATLRMEFSSGPL